MVFGEAGRHDGTTSGRRWEREGGTAKMAAGQLLRFGSMIAKAGPMPIFFEKDFSLGSWASGLRGQLVKLDCPENFGPRFRILRNSTLRWIQYEPKGLPGPAFWLAKPAIVASISHLFLGCFVERGYPKVKTRVPAEVFDPRWQWHGFTAVLDSQARRGELHEHLANLPAERTCLRLWIGKDETVTPYADLDSLLALRQTLATIPGDQWINCLLGVRFSKQECLLKQERLVDELRTPLVRAWEIADLIERAMPVW